MSEKAMQQQSRVLLQKILLQASSCSAHWFEVLGHHSRPHSLARYLNMTYKQLEIILVDAGLASNPPKKKGKKSTTTVFRRDKFLTFLSALNGEEGYWDHFELNKSETTLSRDTYVLRVGENEDGLTTTYRDTVEDTPPSPISLSVEDRNLVNDRFGLSGSTSTKKNKKRKKAPLKPPPPAACQGIPHAKLQQTATNPSVVPPKEWVWIRNNYDLVGSRWRHPECHRIAQDSGQRECDKCCNARTKIRAQIVPLLAGGGSSSVAALFPTKQMLENRVKEHFQECNENVVAFLGSDETKRFLDAASLMGIDGEGLSLDTSANAGRLIGCSECQGPIVQKSNSRTRICCECAKQKRNTQRQDSRRDVESQAAADSKMTNLNMMKSPGKKRMMAKMENLQVENKRLKKSLVYMNKKYAKLQAALASDTVTEEPLDEDGKISDERPLKGIVEQIREQFTKTNTNDSVQTLLRVLNENLQDGERQYTDDDGKEFVESIRETIENYAKVLQNKENSLQFSPHTLRLAMSIWLKNTTAYEELRKGDTAGKWPSSSKLCKLRNATKVRSGRCGVKYERVLKSSSKSFVGRTLIEVSTKGKRRRKGRH